MQPTLSIIIPVYQAESYLKPCIDSVLEQTFSNFELILINDGSTDRSGEVCEEYAQLDARVKVFHQVNKGQSAARNTGINNSLGRYIGFVDNDDKISPAMFEILIKNIEETQADISACSFIQLNEEGEKQHDKHTYERCVLSNAEGMRELLSRKKLDIYVWTKVYDKRFLDQHEIRFEEGKNDEDMLFNYQAFTFSKKCVFEDNPLYLYNHREKSASRLFPQKYLEKYLSGTMYRVNKIETETKQNYPPLYYLALRQKIIYCIQMVSRIINSSSKSDDVYYKEIMCFFKQHRKDVFGNKKYIGLKYIGIVLLLYLPDNLYMQYKRCKNRLTL
ncbi:MAG: glycosyltransferase [Tissierellia bacterium]|nr:glycosyltransferase [Candidatus Cloacimonadota bacterium]MDD4088889.1 glycosyltransferase [Tissierellia bacterium]